MCSNNYTKTWIGKFSVLADLYVVLRRQRWRNFQAQRSTSIVWQICYFYCPISDLVFEVEFLNISINVLPVQSLDASSCLLRFRSFSTPPKKKKKKKQNKKTNKKTKQTNKQKNNKKQKQKKTKQKQNKNKNKTKTKQKTLSNSHMIVPCSTSLEHKCRLKAVKVWKQARGFTHSKWIVNDIIQCKWISISLLYFQISVMLPWPVRQNVSFQFLQLLLHIKLTWMQSGNVLLWS